MRYSVSVNTYESRFFAARIEVNSVMKGLNLFVSILIIYNISN